MDRNLFIAIALSFLVLSLWTMTQPPPPKRPLGGEALTSETPGPTPTAAEPTPSYPAAPESLAPVPDHPFIGSRPVEMDRTDSVPKIRHLDGTRFDCPVVVFCHAHA